MSLQKYSVIPSLQPYLQLGEGGEGLQADVTDSVVLQVELPQRGEVLKLGTRYGGD